MSIFTACFALFYADVDYDKKVLLPLSRVTDKGTCVVNSPSVDAV